MDPVDPGLVGEVSDEGVRGFGVTEGRVLEWRRVNRLRLGYLNCRGTQLPRWMVVEGGADDRAWVELRHWGDVETARAYLAAECPGVDVEDGRYDGLMNPAWGRGSVTGLSFFGAVAGGIGAMVLGWRLVADPPWIGATISILAFLGLLSNDRVSKYAAVGLVAELAAGVWVVVR